MKVFLLSDDLMTTSRIRGAAGDGVEVLNAASLDGLNELLAVSPSADQPRPLVILDLQTRGIDWEIAIAGLKAHARLLAFGPHVWKEQLVLARQAGCDEVLTNGEFYSQLASRLAV